MLFDYEPLYEALRAANSGDWADRLPEQIAHALDPKRHGHLPDWKQLIDKLPVIESSGTILNSDVVRIGSTNLLSENERAALEAQLLELSPWRKGPFEVFGVFIDSEWRCDWKWRRVLPHISSLKNRLVLDVGCGNGYYGWRILGEGAKAVIGIDPLLLNVAQFCAIRKLHGGSPPYFVLPLGIEALPGNMKLFDTVFSMGVFYHRRSPIDHLLDLKDCLAPGGELVLETLIIDGGLGEVLVPRDRYAMMRNVWFIPSCATLHAWLNRCGFEHIRLADVTPTSIDEQRTTKWMKFNSLKKFLDPENPKLTCEGYPAPKRAVFIARTAPP